MLFEMEERTLEKGIRRGRAEGILDLLCEPGEVNQTVREQIYAQKEDEVLRTCHKTCRKGTKRTGVCAESVQKLVI